MMNRNQYFETASWCPPLLASLRETFVSFLFLLYYYDFTGYLSLVTSMLIRISFIPSRILPLEPRLHLHSHLIHSLTSYTVENFFSGSCEFLGHLTIVPSSRLLFCDHHPIPYSWCGEVKYFHPIVNKVFE